VVPPHPRTRVHRWRDRQRLLRCGCYDQTRKNGPEPEGPGPVAFSAFFRESGPPQSSRSRYHNYSLHRHTPPVPAQGSRGTEGSS